MGLRDDVAAIFGGQSATKDRDAIQAVVDSLDPPPPPEPTEDEVAEQASLDAKDAQIADLQAQLDAAKQAETTEDAPVPPDQGQVLP